MKSDYFISYLPKGETYLGATREERIAGGFDEAVAAAKAVKGAERVFITFRVLSNARHYVKDGELHRL